MLDNTARMVATVGIWGAWAVTMAFGLCKMNFSESRDFIVALAIVCVAVVVATALVWRGATRRDRASTAAPGGFPVVSPAPAADEYGRR
jgi:fluoride ion exporter CrcB/FEX